MEIKIIEGVEVTVKYNKRFDWYDADFCTKSARYITCYKTIESLTKDIPRIVRRDNKEYKERQEYELIHNQEKDTEYGTDKDQYSSTNFIDLDTPDPDCSRFITSAY